MYQPYCSVESLLIVEIWVPLYEQQPDSSQLFVLAPFLKKVSSFAGFCVDTIRKRQILVLSRVLFGEGINVVPLKFTFLSVGIGISGNR